MKNFPRITFTIENRSEFQVSSSEAEPGLQPDEEEQDCAQRVEQLPKQG